MLQILELVTGGRHCYMHEANIVQMQSKRPWGWNSSLPDIFTGHFSVGQIEFDNVVHQEVFNWDFTAYCLLKPRSNRLNKGPHVILQP